MLGARKTELIAHLRVRGLDLRMCELNFYMGRFTMIAGLSSLMTCLAYVGIIKIKIPVRVVHSKKCKVAQITDHILVVAGRNEAPSLCLAGTHPCNL